MLREATEQFSAKCAASNIVTIGRDIRSDHTHFTFRRFNFLAVTPELFTITLLT